MGSLIDSSWNFLVGLLYIIYPVLDEPTLHLFMLQMDLKNGKVDHGKYGICTHLIEGSEILVNFVAKIRNW